MQTGGTGSVYPGRRIATTAVGPTTSGQSWLRASRCPAVASKPGTSRKSRLRGGSALRAEMKQGRGIDRKAAAVPGRIHVASRVPGSCQQPAGRTAGPSIQANWEIAVLVESHARHSRACADTNACWRRRDRRSWPTNPAKFATHSPETRAETLKWPSVARAAAKKQHLRTPDAVRPARVRGLPIPVSVDVNSPRLCPHAWINSCLPRVSQPRRHTRCGAPVKYLRASERPDIPEVVRDGPAE